MQCYFHPESEAIATCTACGKAVCQSCSVEVSGKINCRQCVSVRARAPKRVTEIKPTNPLAIISIILGVLGLGGCLCGGSIGGILLGTPAIILGWIARKQLLETDETQQGMQIATIGLILGAVEVILSMFVLLIFGSFYGFAFFNEFFQ